jgi:hypothetical protein
MQSEIDAASVVWLHDRQLRERDWPVLSHVPPRLPSQSEVWRRIDANHRYNGLIGREEARARRADAPPADIAAAKRLIDRYDQKHKDAVDAIDEALLAGLARIVREPGARQSSETAGAMVDRLSILALEIHHMRTQSLRSAAGGAQVQACAASLERLALQRRDLMSCLDALLAEAQAGRAYFKVVRQRRMVDDPSLNHVLDGELQGAGRVAP